MNREKRYVYADNAATVPLTDAVRAAMVPYLGERFGNPSSAHKAGREATRAIFAARSQCAEILGCTADEIVFTSGGTESDNLAIKGTAFAHHLRGHIVATAMEHHAVLHSLSFLERYGIEVTYVKPNDRGIVSPDAIRNAIRADTVLICCMLANNEIGTIQPIRDIVALAHANGICVFCDAVQGMGQIPVSIPALDVDLLSLSGHKLGAPRGVGLLYVRKGMPLVSLIDGGAQEMGYRAGTENTAAIVGMAQALSDAAAECTENAACLSLLSAELFRLLSKIPRCVINGTTEEGLRLPGNVNVSFPGLDAESMVLHLDRMGISVSAGSACTAGETLPSHVLRALGYDDVRASSSLRFTLCPKHTVEDIRYIAACVGDMAEMLYSCI